jgi:hypothetical protein
MAMPWSSAASITASSRTEPPGWITALAPRTGSVWCGAPGQAAQESTKPQHSRFFQLSQRGRRFTQRSPGLTRFALNLTVRLAGGGELPTQL